MDVVTGADRGVASGLEAELAELICSDPDLVAAEFEELMLSAWPQPPVRGPGADCLDRPARAGGRFRVPRARTAATPMRGPGCGEWVRQRSPPRGRIGVAKQR